MNAEDVLVPLESVLKNDRGNINCLWNKIINHKFKENCESKICISGTIS